MFGVNDHKICSRYNRHCCVTIEELRLLKQLRHVRRSDRTAHNEFWQACHELLWRQQFGWLWRHNILNSGSSEQSFFGTGMNPGVSPVFPPSQCTLHSHCMLWLYQWCHTLPPAGMYGPSTGKHIVVYLVIPCWKYSFELYCYLALLLRLMCTYRLGSSSKKRLSPWLTSRISSFISSLIHCQQGSQVHRSVWACDWLLDLGGLYIYARRPRSGS